MWNQFCCLDEQDLALSRWSQQRSASYSNSDQPRFQWLLSHQGTISPSTEGVGLARTGRCELSRRAGVQWYGCFTNTNGSMINREEGAMRLHVVSAVSVQNWVSRWWCTAYSLLFWGLASFSWDGWSNHQAVLVIYHQPFLNSYQPVATLGWFSLKAVAKIARETITDHHGTMIQRYSTSRNHS